MKMRLLTVLGILLSVVSVAYSVPSSLATRSSDVSIFLEERALSFYNLFEKRRGGGGRIGGGYGRTGRTGGGSGGGKPSNALRTSNAGGRTSSGSGAPKLYGGERYYGGGARVPYTAGKKSPSGLKPTPIKLPALRNAFPGYWLWGAYYYHYHVTFTNKTLANNTHTKGVNQTRTLGCLCQKYQVCGCDENEDSRYVQSLLGTGAYKALNHSLITVTKFKGAPTILVNGSLPNGTTAAGRGSGNHRAMLEQASWGVVASVLMYSIWFM